MGIRNTGSNYLSASNKCKCFTKPKQGLAACHHHKANSRGRSWWERKEAFIQILNDLREWETPHFKAYLLFKTLLFRSPQQTQTKGSTKNSCSILKCCPLEPETDSKWSARQLSLFPAAVQLQASWRQHVVPAPPLAMQLLGPQGPMLSGQRTCENTSECSTK